MTEKEQAPSGQRDDTGKGDAKDGNFKSSVGLASSNNSVGSADAESRTFKIVKTGILVFSWIFVGIFTAIIGATLIDLTEIAGCTYAEIGQALTGLHLAMPVGSIGGGILCGRYPGHLDLFLAVFLSTLALSSAALPWCPHLWLMSSVMAVQGLSRSALTCCGNVMVIRMWEEKNAAPLHAMHFGTGFGSFVAPLLAGPFLSPQKNSSNHSTSLQTSAHGALNGPFLTSNATGNSTQDDNTHIYIPYGIEGGYGVFCGILFTLYYVRHKRKVSMTKYARFGQTDSIDERSSKLKDIISPATCARGSFGFGLQMACLLFLFYCCVIGVNLSYSTYLLPVAINGNAKLSKRMATYLTSAYWGSFAAGRFVSAFAAKCVPVHVMFVTEIVATLGTAGALTFFGLTNSLYLWISTCAFAFVSAPVFPSGVAWANLYLDVNGPLMSVFQSAVGVGAFVAGIYGGYGLQEYGPTFPLYLNFAFAVGLVVMFTMMQILACFHGRKEKPIPKITPTPHHDIDSVKIN